MHAHGLRFIFSRRNAAPLTFFLLLVVVVACGLRQTSVTAGGAGGQRPPFPSDEELKKDFNDDDLKAKDDKPGGKWGYGTQLDDNQRNDPSVPAYVRSIQLVSGGGKYQGIHKIKRVEVMNRSSKTIALVQVVVEVFDFNEPEKILLEDVFPFANASIAPNTSQVVEIKTLHPPKMLKALARNGELYGKFGIRITMQEVRFADGSFWRRPPVVLLNSPYLDQSLSFRFPILASLAAFIPPPLQSPDAKRADTSRCALEPGLAAPAFSSVPFEFDTCNDNTGPFVDLIGRKSCSIPATSTCYAHCSDDGWCATWQSPTPCSGPTATPPTGTCEWPPPHPCCTPEMVSFFPAETQFCRWNCKPGESDCTRGTVFADGCYSEPEPVVCPDDFEYNAQKYGGACCPAPPPTPTPPGGGDCQLESCPRGCVWSCEALACVSVPDGGRCESDSFLWGSSPVLVDVSGDGFRLTDAGGGVLFDIDGDGARERLAWTAAEADDAWLSLDRNGNGAVDDGSELFGNFTAQPSPPPGRERNGFLALAVFDRPALGGNSDGVIDGRDAIFSFLRLWRDANHDGVSQPGELHTLPALGLTRLHLDYRESKRTDEFGNRFRYRAKVDDAKGSRVNRWAWDVFLLRAP